MTKGNSYKKFAVTLKKPNAKMVVVTLNSLVKKSRKVMCKMERIEILEKEQKLELEETRLAIMARNRYDNRNLLKDYYKQWDLVDELGTELHNIKRNIPAQITVRISTDLDTIERIKAQLEEEDYFSIEYVDVTDMEIEILEL